MFLFVGAAFDLSFESGQDYACWGRNVPLTWLEETLGDLIKSDKKWLWIVPFENKFGHCPRALLVLVRDERVLTVVQIVAYRRRGEKLHKVLEADEEDAVLLVLTVDLFASM